MVRPGDFTSMLHDEVMTEMADSFFSARKAVDEEIDLFEAKEADVALAGQRALCCCALLHTLLLGEEGTRGLFEVLDVDADTGGLLARVGKTEPCLYIPLPWGLTRKNRFASLLHRVYSSVFNAFDAYLNGSGYTLIHEIEDASLAAYGNAGSGKDVFDAAAGRRTGRRPGRTVGWKRYVAWCAEINARIADVNRNHAPSLVLGMVRQMDVGTITQERASGTGVDGLEASMDVSLCLRPIACHLAGVGDLPALPLPEQVAPQIKDYARRFYTRHGKAVDAEITRLERQMACTLDELTES